MVSEDPFLLTDRTVEVLSNETLPIGISSMIAVALPLPLTVLAGEGWPLVLVEGNVLVSGVTLRTTVFIAGVLIDAFDATDFKEAKDGGRFGKAEFAFVDSVVGKGRFVLAVMEEGPDSILDLVIVTFPAGGPCILVLVFDVVEAVDNLRDRDTAEPR